MAAMLSFLQNTIAIVVLCSLQMSSFMVEAKVVEEHLVKEEEHPAPELLYSDEYWSSEFHTNKTCEQKEAVLNGKGYQATNLAITEEKWRSSAIRNCSATKGLNQRHYASNGRPDDYWHQHFAADESYILPSLIFFNIAYAVMIIAVVIWTAKLKARQLLQATYNLFLSSVVIQEAGVLLQIGVYVRYELDGIDYPRVSRLGRLLEATSETTCLLLLLVLAKGYRMTRARLRLASSVKLTIFMCVYTVTFAALYIHEREAWEINGKMRENTGKFVPSGRWSGHPAQKVLYLYKSPAGYGLIGLRMFGTAWWIFVNSTVFTLKQYPDKAKFHSSLNVVATVRLGPCFILSANSLIGKWVRESIVFAVLHAVTYCGHVLFLILTRPSKSNKIFPYHVRTLQIGVMEISGGVAGNSNLQYTSLAGIITLLGVPRRAFTT